MMDDFHKKSLEMKEKVTQTVLDYYAQGHERAFKPKYPYVMVYVLSREQKVGSLWLPDKQQNKPIHEGIVVETWNPYWHVFYDKHGELQKVWRECDVKIGDHILFQHFAGVPVTGFDIKEFRIVRADANSDLGHVIGTIDYDFKALVLEKLAAQLEKVIPTSLNPETLAGQLIAKFHMVPKEELPSQTISGV